LQQAENSFFSTVVFSTLLFLFGLDDAL